MANRKSKEQAIETREAIELTKTEDNPTGYSALTLWHAAERGKIKRCYKESGIWYYYPSEVVAWRDNFWMHRRGARPKEMRGKQARKVVAR